MYEEALQESSITSTERPDQVGGFEEQGRFQHVEMDVAFWSGEKSGRKDTKTRQFRAVQGPLSSPAGMGSDHLL